LVQNGILRKRSGSFAEPLVVSDDENLDDDPDNSDVEDNSDYADEDDEDTPPSADEYSDDLTGAAVLLLKLSQPPIVHRPKRQRTSPEQLDMLEQMFQTNSMPNQQTRAHLAAELGMSSRRIQIWFQNKRAKVRRARLRQDGGCGLVAGTEGVLLGQHSRQQLHGGAGVHHQHSASHYGTSPQECSVGGGGAMRQDLTPVRLSERTSTATSPVFSFSPPIQCTLMGTPKLQPLTLLEGTGTPMSISAPSSAASTPYLKPINSPMVTPPLVPSLVLSLVPPLQLQSHGSPPQSNNSSNNNNGTNQTQPPSHSPPQTQHQHHQHNATPPHLQQQQQQSPQTPKVAQAQQQQVQNQHLPQHSISEDCLIPCCGSPPSPTHVKKMLLAASQHSTKHLHPYPPPLVLNSRS